VKLVPLEDLSVIKFQESASLHLAVSCEAAQAAALHGKWTYSLDAWTEKGN